MVYLAVEPGLDGEVVVQRELGGNFYGGVSENLRSPIIGASRVDLHGRSASGPPNSRQPDVRSPAGR